MTTTVERILLATTNPGKLRELRDRLAGVGVEVLGVNDVPHPEGEVEETGDTFEANAIIKALAYGRYAQLLTLADDSGLEVDALGGAPGVYSARFAGFHADAATNNALLLQRLGGELNRRARFRCTLAVYVPADLPDDTALRAAEAVGGFRSARADTPPGELLLLVDGVAEGTILDAPQGAEGFGYDPLFLSDDLHKTFAQASIAEKADVSHRGRALVPVIALIQRLAAGGG